MSLPRENKKSFRLRGYDYSAEGAYFITICTYKKERHFGKIVDGEMQLNGAGKIVKEEWLKTSEIRENLKVYIDEFCVMPNHFHAIIIFDTPVLPLHNGRFPFNGNETTP
ncbi:MAG: transposase, partial [Bacteroidota bacterium]